MFTRKQRITAGAAGVVAAAGLTLGLTASANAAPLPKPKPPVCELSGRNVVQLKDGASTYTYLARFASAPAGPGTEVISGWIRDAYEPVPVNLPVHGVAFQAGPGCDMVFSVAYPVTGPDAGNQGVRTFSGAVAHRHLAGAWSETGTEDGAGTFTLAFPVN